MKIEELMIGDFVRTAKDVCFPKGTIVKVRNIDGDNRFLEKKLIGCATCIPINDPDEMSWGVWVEYLEPIPLTREILEKNGFVKWSDHSRTTRSCSMLFDKNTSFCVQEIDGSDSMFTQIHRCGAGSFEHMMHIKYVHQLQQLFRLCGIDKEIILT